MSLRSLFAAGTFAVGMTLCYGSAMAAAVPGKAAPAFTTVASTGETVSLSDYAGKVVVLEWANYECPFVRKHYGSGNMQKLQENAKEDGVVWLTVMSSAEGKQGYYAGEKLNEKNAEKGNAATFVLRDHSGEIGKLYGAKTTPHMFVIDEAGMVAYAGAIDSISGADPKEIDDATNYVTAALEAVKNGETPKVQSATAYGCGVKYAD